MNHYYKISMAALRAIQELAKLLGRVAHMLDCEVATLERTLMRHIPMENEMEEEERIVILH